MSYQSQVLSQSPLLYLPLTETSGTPGPGVFADASGHGHAGSLDSSTTPGAADSFLTGDKAATLDLNAYINFAGGSGFAPLTAFTVEFWLQLQASLYTSHDWLTLHLDDWPGSQSINLELDQRAGPSILTIVDNAHGTSDAATFPLTHVDCWHHYAVVYDSAAGHVRRYLDGVLMSARDVAANPSFAATEGYITALDGPFNLAHLALYGAALSDGQVAANYGAATPRQDAACFVDWLRLSHASGQGYWQSKGDVTEEWAGGAVRIRMPFPIATAAPTGVLGQDAATGLPMWAPSVAVAPPDTGQSVPLPPATVYQTAPVVPTTPVPDPIIDNCPRITCGAAHQLAHKLRTQYDLIRGLLIWMLSAPFLLRVGGSAGAPLGTSVIVWLMEQLIKWLIKTDAEKWLIAVAYAVLAALSVPGVHFISSDAEDIGDAGEEQLAVLAYPVLTCSANVFQLTPAMVANWGARILLDTTDFTEWERHLLVYCIQCTPFSTYDQTAASGALSPSDACAGWTGP